MTFIIFRELFIFNICAKFWNTNIPFYNSEVKIFFLRLSSSTVDHFLFQQCMIEVLVLYLTLRVSMVYSGSYKFAWLFWNPGFEIILVNKARYLRCLDRSLGWIPPLPQNKISNNNNLHEIKSVWFFKS